MAVSGDPFEAQAAISSASKSLLSPACEMTKLRAADAFYRSSYCSAFFLSSSYQCYAVWFLIYRCKFDIHCRNRAVLSCVVLMYLAYPTLVKQSLAALRCEVVGDGLWLAADLERRATQDPSRCNRDRVSQILLYTLDFQQLPF